VVDENARRVIKTIDRGIEMKKCQICLGEFEEVLGYEEVLGKVIIGKALSCFGTFETIDCDACWNCRVELHRVVNYHDLKDVASRVGSTVRVLTTPMGSPDALYPLSRRT
jgi:hypothetical protein